MSKNNIQNGFQIEEPNVYVPWDTDEKGLESLLSRYGLNKVNDGYYCISCKSLGGLPHELGFHFEKKENRDKKENLEKYIKSIGTIIKTIRPSYNPARDGKISELEFFRKEYPNLKESFEEFQSYFEKSFGKPTFSKLEKSGFTYNEWILQDIRIFHYVIDRFGPEEHMRIRKT